MIPISISRRKLPWINASELVRFRNRRSFQEHQTAMIAPTGGARRRPGRLPLSCRSRRRNIKRKPTHRAGDRDGRCCRGGRCDWSHPTRKMRQGRGEGWSTLLVYDEMHDRCYNVQYLSIVSQIYTSSPPEPSSPAPGRRPPWRRAAVVVIFGGRSGHCYRCRPPHCVQNMPKALVGHCRSRLIFIAHPLIFIDTVLSSMATARADQSRPFLMFGRVVSRLQSRIVLHAAMRASANLLGRVVRGVEVEHVGEFSAVSGIGRMFRRVLV